MELDKKEEKKDGEATQTLISDRVKELIEKATTTNYQ
jgi:hypothetical protein